MTYLICITNKMITSLLTWTYLISRLCRKPITYTKYEILLVQLHWNISNLENRQHLESRIEF